MALQAGATVGVAVLGYAYGEYLLKEEKKKLVKEKKIHEEEKKQWR